MEKHWREYLTSNGTYWRRAEFTINSYITVTLYSPKDVHPTPHYQAWVKSGTYKYVEYWEDLDALTMECVVQHIIDTYGPLTPKE